MKVLLLVECFNIPQNRYEIFNVTGVLTCLPDLSDFGAICHLYLEVIMKQQCVNEKWCLPFSQNNLGAHFQWISETINLSLITYSTRGAEIVAKMSLWSGMGRYAQLSSSREGLENLRQELKYAIFLRKSREKFIAFINLFNWARAGMSHLAIFWRVRDHSH